MIGIGDADRQIAADCDHLRQLRKAAVEPDIGNNEGGRQPGVRPCQRLEEIVQRFGRVFRIDERRAERRKSVCPDANNRRPDGDTGLVDAEGHQQAYPTCGAILVAHQRQPHLTILQARHGGREKAAGEEDVGLHCPVREVVEFLLQLVAQPAGVEAKLAAGSADLQAGVGARRIEMQRCNSVRDAAVVMGAVDQRTRRGHAASLAFGVIVADLAKAKDTIPSARRTAR